MNYLSIGEMAALNYISIQTLRYYDEIDLLKPTFVDPDTNYRYYNIKQCAKLDMIQYMKSLGMSLIQIREQFERYQVQSIRRTLIGQRDLIDKRIEELNIMKSAVDVCLQNYERYLSIPREGYIEWEHIGERTIFCYDGEKNIYEHGLETYEYILRELKSQVMLKDFPIVYFSNVGSILRKEMIDQERLVSTEIFVYIDDCFQGREGVEVIPKNDFICIYCSSFWKEKEYAEKLFQYIEDKNYEIVGDYICEVLVELPIFHDDERNMFIKLQVPVKGS